MPFCKADSIFTAVTTFEKRKRTAVVTSLDNAISFLLSGSFFIATVATMNLFVSFLLFNIQIDSRLLLACFFATFSTYSLNKITDIKEDTINQPERAWFVTQHSQKIKVASFAALAAAIILASSESLYALLAVALPIVVGFLYSVGISGFRLKNITALKTVIVTTTLAVSFTIVPLTVAPSGIVESLLVFYFLFAKILVNTTIFDLRDIEGDIAKGVVTLPAWLGRETTTKVLLCLNSSLVLWLLYSYLNGFFHVYLPVLAIFIVYGYAYILFFSRRSKIKKSADLAVDGEWLFMAVAMTPLAH